MSILNNQSIAGPRWYVVHCKATREGYAATALHDLLGVTTYVPEVQRRVRGRPHQTPFFPGYLFVQTDLSLVTPSQINATPGVLRLVSFEASPQPLPGALVEKIRRHIAELNQDGGLPTHNFQPGDSVRLRHGAFQGLEALFLESTRPADRVRVLIQFLGRQRTADIDVHMLEHATPQPAAEHQAKPLRTRRSRGVGRPIKAR
jgi:transcription elongation factor/antiterminator RfaH